MKRFFLILVAAILTACGGGAEGFEEKSGSVATNICLSGNSVMRGSYILPNGETRRSQFAPEVVVGWYFPVQDYSVNGSSVATMRLVDRWAPPSCSVHVILHYHNDDAATFETQLNAALSESLAPIKMLVIANQPTPPVRPEWANIGINAETVRRVAAARGVPLCDVALGTADNSTDGLHPDDTGYATLSGGIVRCIRAATQ